MLLKSSLLLLQFPAHSCISRTQTSYLKEQRNNLDNHTVIIMVDFAENFSFVVQDEVQAFHWNKLQATLDPIFMYYKQNSKSLLDIILA